ncbi:MAG: hypothetical protein NVSMB45_16950 [Ginsengibacter sp.]
METMIQQKNKIDMKDNCIQFMFSYQRRNINQMLSFCNPRGLVHFKPLGDQGKGTIGEFGKSMWSGLIECFPDITNSVDAIVSENGAIKCQVLISGTQSKDFAGIKNKGNHFDADHIFIFHLNNDKIIETIEIDWDHASLVEQLNK